MAPAACYTVIVPFALHPLACPHTASPAIGPDQQRHTNVLCGTRLTTRHRSTSHQSHTQPRTVALSPVTFCRSCSSSESLCASTCHDGAPTKALTTLLQRPTVATGAAAIHTATYLLVLRRVRRRHFQLTRLDAVPQQHDRRSHSARGVPAPAIFQKSPHTKNTVTAPSSHGRAPAVTAADQTVARHTIGTPAAASSRAHWPAACRAGWRRCRGGRLPAASSTTPAPGRAVTPATRAMPTNTNKSQHYRPPYEQGATGTHGSTGGAGTTPPSAVIDREIHK